MQKYQLTKEQIDDVLDKAKEGVISTIGKDGYPYGTPVNFVRIGERVYIHGRNKGEKVDNIAADNRVCFTVMDTGGFENFGEDSCNTTTVYRSVIIRGRAFPVDDPAKKTEVLKAVVAKLVPERVSDHMNEKMVAPTAVFEICPESETGKYHSAKPGNKIMH